MIDMRKKRSLLWGSIVLSLFFVLGNIYLSQFVSPLFSGITYANDRTDVVHFLQKMITHPDFPQQYDLAQETYGPGLKEDVYVETEKRGKEIAYYTELLKKNQNARDVLIKLAMIYKAQGDILTSTEYYKKARAIDPNITH